MINLDDIRSRWQLAAPFRDERGRRLFAANEALALGFGGVTATALATGIARSTINRGIDELQSARNDIDQRVRRPGCRPQERCGPSGRPAGGAGRVDRGCDPW